MHNNSMKMSHGLVTVHPLHAVQPQHARFPLQPHSSSSSSGPARWTAQQQEQQHPQQDHFTEELQQWSQQQLQQQRASAAAMPHHQQSRSRSLSEALYVSQAQARAMLTTYPALLNYNHATLRQKLQELADLLQVGGS